jgi:hypothetical protein
MLRHTYIACLLKTAHNFNINVTLNVWVASYKFTTIFASIIFEIHH